LGESKKITIQESRKAKKSGSTEKGDSSRGKATARGNGLASPGELPKGWSLVFIKGKLGDLEERKDWLNDRSFVSIKWRGKGSRGWEKGSKIEGPTRSIMAHRDGVEEGCGVDNKKKRDRKK